MSPTTIIDHQKRRLPVPAILLLFALVTGVNAEQIAGRDIIWDRGGDTPQMNERGNPYNMLLFMFSREPILDHLGEPHDHGHILQMLVDGGNGLQDPPNVDGTPGGDDSLALGNFNMITMRGVSYPYSPDGKSGQFYSYRLFIPYVREGVYYLRLWEGDDIATAPYYQNSSEYKASTGDQGGGMIRMAPQLFQGPNEADWKFGRSVARPDSS